MKTKIVKASELSKDLRLDAKHYIVTEGQHRLRDVIKKECRDAADAENLTDVERALLLRSSVELALKWVDADDHARDCYRTEPEECICGLESLRNSLRRALEVTKR